jgi:hypothetical protein
MPHMLYDRLPTLIIGQLSDKVSAFYFAIQENSVVFYSQMQCSGAMVAEFSGFGRCSMRRLSQRSRVQ